MPTEDEQHADCRPPEGGKASYFGADQPRITAEARLPWAALGAAGPPSSIRVEVAAAAWHRSRWMSLSGAPPEEALADPSEWRRFSLARRERKGPYPGGD